MRQSAHHIRYAPIEKRELYHTLLKCSTFAAIKLDLKEIVDRNKSEERLVGKRATTSSVRQVSIGPESAEPPPPERAPS